MEQTHVAEMNHLRREIASPAEFSHIPGWGVDEPLERRVGSPRAGQFTPEENGVSWTNPEQQNSDVEIFISTERPGITPVFGTRQPPRGLSGMMRRLAYGYSEGKRRHWLALMMADRVDVVESTLSDVFMLPHSVEDQEAGKARKIRASAVVVTALGLGAAGYLAYRLSRVKRAGRRSAHS